MTVFNLHPPNTYHTTLVKKKTFKQPHAGLCVKIYKQESNEVSITLKTWNKLEVNNLYFCRRVKREQWRFFQEMRHFVQEMRQLTYKKKFYDFFQNNFSFLFDFFLIFSFKFKKGHVKKFLGDFFIKTNQKIFLCIFFWKINLKLFF